MGLVQGKVKPAQSEEEGEEATGSGESSLCKEKAEPG